MNSGAIQALIEIVIAAAGFAAWLMRDGKRQGRLEQILEQLVKNDDDKETRIRDLERGKT